MQPTFFWRLLAIDKTLSEKGYPSLSKWWSRTLRTFFATNQTWLICRVGRRGGKGLTSSKIAVALALFFPVNLPPGELAYVQFLSVDRDEASGRLRMICAMLDCLGVRYDSKEGLIELRDRPIAIRVTTASTRGVVGRTSIGIFADEGARWKDDNSTDPAKEILASIGPSLLTTGGRGFFLSAPWSTNDYHAEKFAAGTNDFQMVAHAPTWIANPTITEAQTRLLEPDPRIHLREYGAEASDSVSSVIGPDEFDALTSDREAYAPAIGVTYSATLDAALKKDSWVVNISHREMVESGGGTSDVLVQDAILRLEPTFLRPIKLDEAIGKTAELLIRYRVRKIYSDAHYEGAIRPKLAERGIKLEVLTMAPSATTARVEVLQSRMANGGIRFVKHQVQRKEFLEARLIQANGRTLLKAPDRRGCHDDTISAVLLQNETTVINSIPISPGNLVVQHSSVTWDAESRQLLGGKVRYFTRHPNGSLAEREPPIASQDFDIYARENLTAGRTTANIEKWLLQRSIALGPRVSPQEALYQLECQEAEGNEALNVPIAGNW